MTQEKLPNVVRQKLKRWHGEGRSLADMQARVKAQDRLDLTFPEIKAALGYRKSLLPPTGAELTEKSRAYGKRKGKKAVEVVAPINPNGKPSPDILLKNMPERRALLHQLWKEHGCNIDAICRCFSPRADQAVVRELLQQYSREFEREAAAQRPERPYGISREVTLPRLNFLDETKNTKKKEG